jgi:hypothetical protein
MDYRVSFEFGGDFLRAILVHVSDCDSRAFRP